MTPVAQPTPMRCGWFGEGRGQCLLPDSHRGEHTCEEDGRLLRNAQTGLMAAAERQRQLDAAPSNSFDALTEANARHEQWLVDRIAWLRKEAHSGGDWEHLNTRMTEAAYVLDKYRAALAALKVTP